MKKSNISIGELKSLTTIELLEKVLDYEHLPLLHMHNELQAGIDALEKNYNGLSELLNRKDVAEVVAEKYLKIEVLGYSPSATLIEKGKYALGITFLETLLAQQSVRNGFSQALKSQVGQKMIYNIETKSQDPEVYAFYSKVPTALVISRMLKDDNYGGFLSKTSSNVELSTFIEKGQIPSETTIETILSAGAKAYSK